VITVPADTGAGVGERSTTHRSGFAFSDLRKVPPAAVRRAAARAVPPRDGMIMSHVNHVYCLLQARERDRREHREWVQGKLRRLRATTPG